VAKLKPLAKHVKDFPLGHSILLGTADAQERSRIATSICRRHPKEFAALVTECERLIKEPIPARPYALFNRYRVDGDRSEYQAPYVAIHLLGLPALRMGALLTNRADILGRLQDYLWEVCNYGPWALPAHLPAEINPELPVVDLFAAITAEHLGETLDLLSDRLPREIVERCRYEVQRRVLEPMFEHPMQFGWAKNVHNNWSAVCYGAVGCAAALTRLEQTPLVPLLELCRDGIRRYLKLLDPGDGVAEGVGYWRFAMVHAARFADVLEKITKGKERMLEWPRFRRAGRFLVHCYLPPDRYVNFSDCSGAVSMGREVPYLLMRHGKHMTKLAWLLNQPLERDASLTAATSQSIRVWMPPKLPPRPRPPKKTLVHFKDMGWVIARESWDDPNAAVLAVKAGHNGESHNQLDVGHYIYAVFGQDFVHDLGRPTYTRQIFSNKRYEDPFCNAEGHNTITISGVAQGVGAEHRAEVKSVESLEDGEQVVLDLTALYPGELVKSVSRTFLLSREGKPRSLRVSDIIEGEAKGPIEVRIQVGVPMRLQPDGVALTGKHGKVRLEVLTEGVNIEKGRFAKLNGDVPSANYLRLTTEPGESVTQIDYVFTPVSPRSRRPSSR